MASWLLTEKLHEDEVRKYAESNFMKKTNMLIFFLIS